MHFSIPLIISVKQKNPVPPEDHSPFVMMKYYYLINRRISTQSIPSHSQVANFRGEMRANSALAQIILVPHREGYSQTRLSHFINLGRAILFQFQLVYPCFDKCICSMLIHLESTNLLKNLTTSCLVTDRISVSQPTCTHGSFSKAFCDILSSILAKEL